MLPSGENLSVARVFITGSTDGLGLAAARQLVHDGHEVVLHARNNARAATLPPGLGAVVVGDLSSADETHDVAHQVNAVGRMDAVIHNAAVYVEPSRATTAEGHARTVAVNTLAPYILTALITRPRRLVYLSSGMHHSGTTDLDDLDWNRRRWNGTQAYCDSKLHVTALAMAVARYWPDTLTNAVDPGWVPTKMGGPAAPDDLELGHLTQTWLAVSDEPPATATGGYWQHRQRQTPAAATRDTGFQDELLERLAPLAGVPPITPEDGLERT
jgi:NAD(P)-dependent dehydrogenase (short-subunit alcohol dehydrogenase family)